jgi:hypothetical protein
LMNRPRERSDCFLWDFVRHTRILPQRTPTLYKQRSKFLESSQFRRPLSRLPYVLLP